MNRAYIAFGANLSNPRETLMRSVSALGRAGVVVDRVSNLWRSPAWPPGTAAPDYRNAVLAVRTNHNAAALMHLLLDIETSLGRVRTVPNAPRTCDLDLLDHAGRIRQHPHCTLPHPRLHQRDFVLLPLAEVVDPDWTHPVSGLNVAAMIAALA